MKTAFHTRSTGKQLSYRIEYDGNGYKIFLRERFLKLGTAAPAAKVPRWSEQRETANLTQAVADIESLEGMPEI
ncbi:hypothetical protein [Ramlibacter sp.]|uniref:hypothetical protein n=1 Tax=Ramlibacter sp. TaxID=1917967 RepID=UPI003D0D7803